MPSACARRNSVQVGPARRGAGPARTVRSMAESREEVDPLLDLMGRTGQVTVADGAPR